MKILVFVLLIVATPAWSQTPLAEKLNELHKQKFDWMIAKNYDSLNWVTDETLKFIHSNGWIQSKKEFIEDLKTDRLNYTSIIIRESSVSVYQDRCAVITGQGTFRGLMPDKSEFVVNLLYTEVYMKSKKQWRLVSRHACKI